MSGLRNLLEETAAGAKVYDVTDRALVLNRRRHARRVGLTAGAVAVGILVIGVAVNRATQAAIDLPPTVQNSETPAPPAPTGPQACDIAKLPMPAGNWAGAAVAAGDLTGRFLAGLAYGGTHQAGKIVLWDNGNVAAALPIQGKVPTVVAVNSRGDILEISFDNKDKIQSFVYHDGQWTRLKGDYAHAEAMSSKGVIVGRLDVPNVVITPVIWRSFTAEPQPLEVPDGWFVEALGIDDDGNIVGLGRLKSAPSVQYPMIWSPDGKVRQIDVPASTSKDRQVRPISLHSGQVTFYLSSNFSRTFEYWRVDLATGKATRLNVPPGVGYIGANGWRLSPRVGMLAFGSDVITLPNLPEHIPESRPANAPPRIGITPNPVILPNTFSPAVISSMSLDGKVIGGSDTGSLPDVPVAVIWRCH